jgi:dCMP deaminase
MKTDWDKRFLDLAEHISTWSKDQSRKVGAIIVNDDKRVVSFGYNGFPSGVDDDKEERHERPVKYDWVVHAEENAIANAARIGVSTKGTTIYLNLFPCARCAGVLINSGIKKVVVSKEPDFEDSKYGEEFKISKQKLSEAKVEIQTPERRTFIIPVGNLDKEDIEEYTKSIVDKYKNQYNVDDVDASVNFHQNPPLKNFRVQEDGED